MVNLFEEFFPLSALAAAGSTRATLSGPVVGNLGFLDSALDLIGDIFDPFVPGGAGSELRTGAFGGDVARQNAARRRAGLPAISTGRRRRRKALTNDDVKLALTIASAISKKAAENFILTRTRGA